MANTANLALPKPDPTADVDVEFYRLQVVLDMLDAIIHANQLAIAGKSDSGHGHPISAIENLATELAAKMPASRTFSLDDLTDVEGASEAAVNYILARNAEGIYVPSSALAALGTHGHLIAEVTNLPAAVSGAFRKANPYAVAFTKTGAGAATVKAGTVIEVNGTIVNLAADTAISMPTLVAGTDYAVWAKDAGTFEATADHVSPPAAGDRKIGGFHYAPGGNATALNTGGNSTPQINEYSFWDLKFRPACLDPRGMTLVAGAFWRDIYHLGVDHHINGTSRFNVTIADGSSPPKIPTAFGGNGSSIYSTFNWWEATEVLRSHGKRLPTYDEFALGAFGSKEAVSSGTDPVSTILRSDYTSKWGLMLATGNVWEWGAEFSYRQDGAETPWAYRPMTGGRGSLYLYNTLGLVASLFGGSWGYAAGSGSRASYWFGYPWSSDGVIGARGCSDHVCHV